LAEYTIPEAQQPTLNLLRTISNAAFNELISALELSASTFPDFEGITEAEADSIREAVLELYRVRAFFEEEVVEFAEAIATSLQESSKFPVEEIPSFKDRLTKLLTIARLGIAAKASSLKLEFERRYCDTRIVTDARPIYGDDPTAPPKAVMITHTLRVAYHDNTRETHEIYFNLDDEALIELRERIDRAEAKSKSLKTMFESANVQVFND
jgi:hypothetical protein